MGDRVNETDRRTFLSTGVTSRYALSPFPFRLQQQASLFLGAGHDEVRPRVFAPVSVILHLIPASQWWP